jgi:hypothetical protein
MGRNTGAILELLILISVHGFVKIDISRHSIKSPISNITTFSDSNANLFVRPLIEMQESD